MENSSYLGGALLSHYMQAELQFADMTPEDKMLLETGSPILHNAIYSCYCSQDKIIIHFH